jgi:uncharacterized protein (DUF488 family)
MKIYTIGHSNHSQDKFVHLLVTEKIEALVDVRSNPNSRWAIFANRDNLESVLKPLNIKYIYHGDLLGGHPQEPDFIDSITGKVDYDTIRQLDFFQKGIQHLIDEVKIYRVCIMCSEEDPNSCHRNLLVAESLRRLGVEVFHIRGDGRVQTDEELWKERAGVPVNQTLLPL